MSSISSSDRARQDDQIRKIREEYENREADSNKKKQAETRRLQENHSRELKNVSETYEDQIADLKDRNRETLTERDQANQRKIDDVRQVYREALRKKMEDSDSDKQIQREAYQGSLKKERQISDSQRENSTRQMQNELNETNERFSRNLNELKEKSRTDVASNARKLNEAHEKEKREIARGQEDMLAQKTHDMDQLRQSYGDQLKNSERKNTADNNRWANKYYDTVQSLQQENADNMNSRNMVLSESQRTEKERFDRAIDNKTQQIERNNEAFRDSVDERLDRQVRSRNSQIQSLKTKLNNEIANDERLRGLERRNLQTDYEKKMDLLQQQREDAIVRMKDLNQQRIDDVNKRNSDLLRDADRSSKSEMNLTVSRNREDRVNLVQQHEDSLQHIRQQTDKRVQSITDIANKNNADMANYYSDSIDQMRDNFSDRLDNQRDKAMQEHANLNTVMGEKFRGMEANFDRKLEQTVRGYEEKLTAMRDKQEKDMKHTEARYVQQLKDRDKAAKVEKNSVEMKYEAKIAQLNESHQDQLDRMSRRHEEDMQNVAAKMGSYSKKA